MGHRKSLLNPVAVPRKGMGEFFPLFLPKIVLDYQSNLMKKIFEGVMACSDP